MSKTIITLADPYRWEAVVVRVTAELNLIKF